MKRFKITNTKTGATFDIENLSLEAQEMEKPGSTLCLAWGKPERPEIGADGKPTGKMLPAEYTIVEEDITEQLRLEAERHARKKEIQRARRAKLKSFKKKKLSNNELAEIVEELLMELFQEEEDYP